MSVTLSLPFPAAANGGAAYEYARKLDIFLNNMTSLLPDDFSKNFDAFARCFLEVSAINKNSISEKQKLGLTREGVEEIHAKIFQAAKTLIAVAPQYGIEEPLNRFPQDVRHCLKSSMAQD